MLDENSPILTVSKVAKELNNNQKRFLMEVLDKNLLYVNYTDMDDAELEFFGLLKGDDE